MAARQLIRNATVFDSAAGRLRPGCQIVIEGARIAAVSEAPLQIDDVAQVIDAGGRVVLPGLCMSIRLKEMPSCCRSVSWVRASANIRLA